MGKLEKMCGRSGLTCAELATIGFQVPSEVAGTTGTIPWDRIRLWLGEHRRLCGNGIASVPENNKKYEKQDTTKGH
jgi:hypothetical protein